VLERFRLFLDRPLDPSAGRAILALAAAILLGVATLLLLAGGEPDRRASTRGTAEAGAPRLPAPSRVDRPPSRGERSRRAPRQDPQDDPASAAARRAARESRSHRALQHLPYRHGGLSVELVGVRGPRALLSVSAPTLAAARRGWRAFLRRYRDSGSSYAPVFRASRSRRGGGA
jgi:hypothetical protein